VRDKRIRFKKSHLLSRKFYFAKRHKQKSTRGELNGSQKQLFEEGISDKKRQIS
jgi:hypothetical protein